MSNSINSSNFFNYNMASFLHKKTAESSSSSSSSSKKADEVNLQSATPKAEETQISAEDMDKYINAVKNYALSFGSIVQSSSIENIDPTKYLSPERIKYIENLMPQFDTLYNEVYDSIDSEFGQSISKVAKQNLALLYVS